APGRGDHGGGSTAAPDQLGEDQRRLVRLRQEAQSKGLLRHLRRRQIRHSVVGQSVRGRGRIMSDARFGGPWWTRRGFLQGSAAAIAGIYDLAGRLGHAAEIPNEFDGSKFQLKAPEPNPKSGGVLRYGITMRPPHFDVHQSGTINNLG